MNEKRINDELGALVRKLRKHRGLTQHDIANAIGITYQQFQKYEAGKNRISSGQLFAIAKTLDLSPTIIFSLLDHRLFDAWKVKRHPSKITETRLTKMDIKTIFHGISSNNMLHHHLERLSTAIKGGQQYEQETPEWIAFQALFWQELDALSTQIDYDDIDTILERLDCLGISVKDTGFITDDLKYGDLNKVVTPNMKPPS